MIASSVAEAASATLTEGVTYFSSEEFAACAARSLDGLEAIAISVRGSGPARSLNGLSRRRPLGTREIMLGPFGLFSSPGWSGELQPATIHAVLDELRRRRTVRFTWNVRFDHEALATALTGTGLTATRTSTHVIGLDGGYDAVLSRYSRTTRYEVLRSRRSGVVIGEARSADDVRAYCLLHQEMMASKGASTQYSQRLIEELLILRSAARLITATYEHQLVAGGMFFHDGNSVFHWNAASDRKYSHLFASKAVIDEAVHWAVQLGSSSVNLGGSIGIKSLEGFKERWGAREVFNWQFHWQSPGWSRMLNAYSRGLRICRMS